jgi:hypothetical protein
VTISRAVSRPLGATIPAGTVLHTAPAQRGGHGCWHNGNGRHAAAGQLDSTVHSRNSYCMFTKSLARHTHRLLDWATTNYETRWGTLLQYVVRSPIWSGVHG